MHFLIRFILFICFGFYVTVFFLFFCLVCFLQLYLPYFMLDFRLHSLHSTVSVPFRKKSQYIVSGCNKNQFKKIPRFFRTYWSIAFVKEILLAPVRILSRIWRSRSIRLYAHVSELHKFIFYFVKKFIGARFKRKNMYIISRLGLFCQ
jgi:hypothetical protein